MGRGQDDVDRQRNAGFDPSRATAPTSRAAILLAALLIVLAAVAVYANSFQGVLLGDDQASILANPTIRHLWPIWPALQPPTNGETVSGRPLLNLSLAANYALGGTAVWGYHATNLAIHILAALTLFGILRRTLTTVDRGWKSPLPSAFLALAITLLWTVHPLQTESVTFVIQRAQSMASLFYLLTLYCVVRGAMSSRAVFWYAAAALACLLGAATKELLVTAPLLVLLYDRTLLTGTFAQSLRRRWGLYLALAATWLLLVWLVLSAGLLPRRSEYLAPNPWSYALTQPQVICHYLRLSLWPHPLCFWYKWPLARTWGAILPGASVVAALLAATLWGLLRRQPWALLGAWFFLILAPTSSILPLSDLACEHWMYLPLAAVLAALVLGAHRAGQSLLRRRVVSRPVLKVVSGCLTLVACTVLGILTVKRNADYRTEVSLWRSAAASAPWNDGAHNNLGALLADQGKLAEGIAHLQRSVEINPTVAVPRCNLANALAKQGRLGDAIAQYRKAVELQPNFVDAHNNLGFTLLRQGQPEEALAHLRKALEIDPACANAHNNLGLVLRQQGNLVEAIAHYRKAVAIRPDNAELHCNLGNALRQQGLDAEAAAQYQKAVEIRPDFVEAHLSLGLALQGLGRVDEAIAHFQKAVEIRPADIEARQQLGNVLYGWKRDRQAVAQWREVLRARPDAIDTLNTMAWALATSPDASLRNGQEAVALAHRAAQFCDARDPAILDTLAAAYAESGRFPEAIHMAQQAQSLAESQHNRPLVGNIAGRIKLYRTGAPFRDRR